jgi:alkanesulfonate monooxygenase SsuD/methylene tetrahydromethanopterin reductase-like flavin-dependent oxidoreductase (luciferase family)
MKLCHFSLQADVTMQDDFLPLHKSPWVLYPNQEFADPERRHQMFNNVLDELELSSSLGIDGVCVNEHHSSLYAVTPCPNLYASALARSTTDTAILVLGNSIIARGNPIRLAEEYAFIDCLSGGRLVAGLPVGAPMDVNHLMGVVPSTTRPRFREAVDMMVQGWTRPGPFPFNGRFYKERYVNPDPLPMQKPHPPIWCLGAESVDTWEYAANHDYAYGFFSFYGQEFGEAGLNEFWQTAEACGRDRNPYRVAFLQMICLSETDEATEEEYADHVFYLFDKEQTTPRYLADPPGYKLERSLAKKDTGRSGAERLREARDSMLPTEGLTRTERWRRFVENNVVLAGSPETVRTKLRAMAERLNVGHLLCLFQMGSLPHDQTMRNIKLFCEEVLPYVRDIHDDTEWVDHWWPQGAKQKIVAAAASS